MLEPLYLQLHKEGELANRVDEAVALLRECRLCPRECKVDRLNDERGYCRTGRRAMVSSYNAHFGEEAPLVGRYGSGTIFFTSCNLRCSFCQNFEISHLGEGGALDPQDLAAIMLELERRGCHNINLVTPTHVVPQVLEALLVAVENGLAIPVVYNSSGYERAETIRLLRGIVDIYMPDFKFWDEQWSERYCNAPDYRDRAVSALKEMHAQVGDLKIDENGVAQRGLLVRHLVMPHGIAGTGEVMKFISEDLSPNTYVNVMDQYRPCGTAHDDHYLNRRLLPEEYTAALESTEKAGLERLDQRQGARLLFRF